MSERRLENYTETDHTQNTIAQGEYGFLAAAKRGDSAAFDVLCKQAASTVFKYRAANDAEQRGCRGRRTRIVSAGLCSSPELPRRFSVFHKAVPHCHQRFLDETTQEEALAGCVVG